jgi:hypothetical protein
MSLNRRAFFCTPLILATWQVNAAKANEIVGAYDIDRMKAIKGLTFPRVHLYDAKGKLIDRKLWPREFKSVKDHAGQAFCCVSDKPSPPGSLGPPPDCKIVVYGENVLEHFDGLHDGSGQAVRYQTLPRHRYLVVEYYADWCPPCQPARRALQGFLATPESHGYLALVVDFSKMQV